MLGCPHVTLLVEFKPIRRNSLFKTTPLRRNLVRTMPYGKRFTAYDMCRAMGVPEAKPKVSMMLAAMVLTGVVVRDGVGVYHRAPSAGPKDTPRIQTFRHKRVFHAVKWEDGYVTPSDLVKMGVVHCNTYACNILSDLVTQGKVVRVKHGYYTRKGSAFDRSTPKRGPVDPFS